MYIVSIDPHPSLCWHPRTIPLTKSVCVCVCVSVQFGVR